jgi:hypothetical protein
MRSLPVYTTAPALAALLICVSACGTDRAPIPAEEAEQAMDPRDLVRIRCTH